jgi:hypothetical protein
MAEITVNQQKLHAALVKTPKGRIYIAMNETLDQLPLSVIYYAQDDVMALLFPDNLIVPIAQDMDLEFSEQILGQDDISLVSVSDHAGDDEQRLRLPISVQ